jgi:hypothetical protein
MFKTTTSLSLNVLCATALLVTAAPASAASLIATVAKVTMTGDSSLGGCMVMLSVNPRTVLPNCGNVWVSFSCSGEFTDAVRAYRMLDQAQLALATGKTVQVWFQDDKKHNGYCFANRIDVLR